MGILDTSNEIGPSMMIIGGHRKRFLSLRTEHEDERKNCEDTQQTQKMARLTNDSDLTLNKVADVLLSNEENASTNCDTNIFQKQSLEQHKNLFSSMQTGPETPKTCDDDKVHRDNDVREPRKRLISLNTSFEDNPKDSITFTSCNCIVTEIKKIGNGKFNTVYKGKLFGLNGMGSKTEVAMKQISNCRNDKEFQSFKDGVDLLESLDPHLNLVNMIGSCETGLNERNKRTWLFLEFCQHGNLKTYLIKNKDQLICDQDTDPSNYRCLVLWSFEIAKGMQFLAERNIIHGDLSASNILLHENPLKNERLMAKITGIGNSKSFTDCSRRQMIPWRWAALEVLTKGYFSTSSDVWSFGVVFYEIVSFGRIPYTELESNQSILKALEDGQRLLDPITTTDSYSLPLKDIYNQISSNCFQSEPIHRATFSEISNILQNYMSTKELEQYRAMCESYSRKCKKVRSSFNRGWSLQSI